MTTRESGIAELMVGALRHEDQSMRGLQPGDQGWSVLVVRELPAIGAAEIHEGARPEGMLAVLAVRSTRIVSALRRLGRR